MAHRRMKLLEHAMNIFEIIPNERMQGLLNVMASQIGFTLHKETTNALLVVQKVHKEYNDKITMEYVFCGH